MSAAASSLLASAMFRLRCRIAGDDDGYRFQNGVSLPSVPSPSSSLEISSGRLSVSATARRTRGSLRSPPGSSVRIVNWRCAAVPARRMRNFLFLKNGLASTGEIAEMMSIWPARSARDIAVDVSYGVTLTPSSGGLPPQYWS